MQRDPIYAPHTPRLRNETEERVRYVVSGTRVSPEVVEYPDLKQVTAQSRHPSTTGGELFLIHDVGGKGVTEREETGIELLLSEPEIVAWLEPHENKDDDDADEPPRAA